MIYYDLFVENVMAQERDIYHLEEEGEPRVLTKEVVLGGSYLKFIAKKVALDRIRPFTQDDVDNIHGEFFQDEQETYFFDLEGRRHKVRIGYCLCIGTSLEDRRATAQKKVDLYRDPVSELDEEGFRLYKLKEPRPLTCFDIPHPFYLDNQNETQLWECLHPKGGYIVWDEKQPELPLRVIQRDIFDITYEAVRISEDLPN